MSFKLPFQLFPKPHVLWFKLPLQLVIGTIFAGFGVWVATHLIHIIVLTYVLSSLFSGKRVTKVESWWKSGLSSYDQWRKKKELLGLQIGKL